MITCSIGSYNGNTKIAKRRKGIKLYSETNDQSVECKGLNVGYSTPYKYIYRHYYRTDTLTEKSPSTAHQGQVHYVGPKRGYKLAKKGNVQKEITPYNIVRSLGGRHNGLAVRTEWNSVRQDGTEREREREREGSHLDTRFETKMESPSWQHGWLGSGAFIDIQSIWLSRSLSPPAVSALDALSYTINTWRGTRQSTPSRP